MYRLGTDQKMLKAGPELLCDGLREKKQFSKARQREMSWPAKKITKSCGCVSVCVCRHAWECMCACDF